MGNIPFARAAEYLEVDEVERRRKLAEAAAFLQQALVGGRRQYLLKAPNAEMELCRCRRRQIRSLAPSAANTRWPIKVEINVVPIFHIDVK